MRILYIIFFIVFSSSCFAQNDSGATPASTEEEASEDSLELKDVKKEEPELNVPVTKSAEKTDRKIKRNAYGYEIEGTAAEDNMDADPQMDQQTIVVANQFESVKLQATNQRIQRSPSVVQQAEMDDAVLYLENNAPNSFEYNYFNYVSGNYDVTRVNNLVIAEELRPNNTDVQVQMAGYDMIKDNIQSAKTYLDKLIKAGRLGKSVLSYSEDLLLSVPENGTLITHGFDDSYGTWYVQNVNGVRKDITLISLDFMQSEFYRKKIMNKGYSIPVREKIDVTFLKQFCHSNSTKQLALSMTTPKEYFKPMLSNLYVTGLVLEYRTATFQNFDRNEYLWQTALKKTLVENANDEKAKVLSANYLPMLLQIRKVYKQQGNITDVKKIDAALDRIAAQCRKYDQVQKLKSAY